MEPVLPWKGWGEAALDMRPVGLALCYFGASVETRDQQTGPDHRLCGRECHRVLSSQSRSLLDHSWIDHVGFEVPVHIQMDILWVWISGKRTKARDTDLGIISKER